VMGRNEHVHVTYRILESRFLQEALPTRSLHVTGKADFEMVRFQNDDRELNDGPLSSVDQDRACDGEVGRAIRSIPDVR
jgi:hypothetical protein